jgi:hypothetical protein
MCVDGLMVHGFLLNLSLRFFLIKIKTWKVILVTDNVPSHHNELKSGEIRVIFLPPNVTSSCQRMDQGVIEALKKKNTDIHFLNNLQKLLIMDGKC